MDYYSKGHETRAQAFLPALSRPTFGWAREGPSSRNPKGLESVTQRPILEQAQMGLESVTQRPILEQA